MSVNNYPPPPSYPPQGPGYGAQPPKRSKTLPIVLVSSLAVITFAGAGLVGYTLSSPSQSPEAAASEPAAAVASEAAPAAANEAAPADVAKTSEPTPAPTQSEKSFTEQLIEEEAAHEEIDRNRTYIKDDLFVYYTGYSQEAIQERIKELEIPTGLSPEEFARADIQRYEDWRNAGATDENYLMESKVFKDDGSHEGYTRSEWAQQLAEEHTKMYAPAVFGEGWGDAARSTQLAGEMTSINADVLENYFATKGDQSAQPYMQKLEFTGMLPDYDALYADRVIRYGMTMSATNDNSSIASDLDGSTYDRSVHIEEVDGVEHATDWITERNY